MVVEKRLVKNIEQAYTPQKKQKKETLVIVILQFCPLYCTRYCTGRTELYSSGLLRDKTSIGGDVTIQEDRVEKHTREEEGARTRVHLSCCLGRMKFLKKGTKCLLQII